MQESSPNRQWGRLEVPFSDFLQRIKQLRMAEEHNQTASVMSRFALIHQVAKAYVLDNIRHLDVNSLDVAIEEITDPPIYDLDIEGGVVIIQYSYDESANAPQSSLTCL